MGHAAALYLVRVRGKGRGHSNEHHPFGDFDGNGGNLLDVLRQFATGREVENVNGNKLVRCTDSDISGDELILYLRHGESGVAADIVDAAGAPRLHQNVEDTHLVPCAMVFRLPPASTEGLLCVHVNNGRGVRGLFGNELIELFRDQYPERVLVIEACVSASALKEAVDNDKLDKVKLVRLVPPSDRANAALRQWVPAGTRGRIELDISGTRMVADRLKRFLGGESGLFPELVEYEGLTFDEAKVEVEVAGGKRRTYNIQKPDSGHPMTEDLSKLSFGDDGYPTRESLVAALRDVLTNVTT